MGCKKARCRSDARLDGKVVVITGANTGIGKETTLDLARRGARVVIACRNMDKAKKALDDVTEALRDVEGAGSLSAVELNCCSLASVRQCAQQLLAQESRIDILINNAGIMTTPEGKTEDGLEIQLGVNHFSHFLLTCLLLPRLRSSAIAAGSDPGRIITLASLAHIRGNIMFDDLNAEKGYNSGERYCQSKLANVLFAKELAKRLKEHDININSYAVHPGFVATELSRHLSDGVFPGATFFWDNIMKLWIKTPEEGAQTTIHCAVDEEAGKETGLYYSDCRPTAPARRALDEDVARRLWEESVKITGVSFDPFTAADVTSSVRL